MAIVERPVHLMTTEPGKKMMRTACAVLWLLCAIPARAVADPPPMPRATGAFLALSVADLDASARWYAEALGLRVVLRTPKHDKSAAVVLEGAGLIVELIKHDESVPLRTAAPAATNNILVQGIVKAGAIVEDFDGLVATLRARHVRIAFGPYPARAGTRANVIIEDNAGNLVQFFGDSLPGSEPGRPR
jgi:catechol 2,3-dioxygenase-like lactoylglutathione lyase family enzyme